MSRTTLDIAARVINLRRNSVAALRLARIRTAADDHARDFLPDTAGPNERRVRAQELLDAARQLHVRECGPLATDCREAAKGGAR